MQHVTQVNLAIIYAPVYSSTTGVLAFTQLLYFLFKIWPNGGIIQPTKSLIGGLTAAAPKPFWGPGSSIIVWVELWKSEVTFWKFGDNNHKNNKSLETKPTFIKWSELS